MAELHTINKKAAKVFGLLIQQLNGDDHVRIDNTGKTFMPVVVEKIGHDLELAGRAVDIFSVSHYYEVNGDLVPDPDMTFAVSKINQEYIYPLTFQDGRSYQEAVFTADGKWKIRPALQKELAVFAGMWMNNIKHQQFSK